MADYIRRILAKAQFTGNFQSEYPTALIHALLDDVPSEDVRPVLRGKWIDAVLPNDNGGLPVIVCDQCNTFYPLQFGASHRFCPNCGADMRGEQE